MWNSKKIEQVIREQEHQLWCQRCRLDEITIEYREQANRYRGTRELDYDLDPVEAMG